LEKHCQQNSRILFSYLKREKKKYNKNLKEKIGLPKISSVLPKMLNGTSYKVEV
jgi:hypothetical protein